MKDLKILLLLLLCSSISFYACQEEKKTTKLGPAPNMSPTALPNLPSLQSNPNTPTAEPPQNTAGVWHYTCSNGCAGGSGSATACATCGTTLVHNQAYHASTNTSPTLPSAVPSPTASGQNAAGVWHYTCGNGCAGGAASAGSCASCGGTLAHNQAYHL